MDKIDIHLFLNEWSTKDRTVALFDVVNELIEGYNEMNRILDTMVWKVFGLNDKEIDRIKRRNQLNDDEEGGETLSKMRR